MIKDESIYCFAKTLAGKYSNKEQAQEKPRDFANINIYYRPLEWSILKGPWFYSEQSYDYAPWSPYKQSFHRLIRSKDIFIVENYSLTSPEKIAGSGFKPELLIGINKTQLYKREGCSMHFQKSPQGMYIGHVEPGKECLIRKGGKLTYLVSHVEFNDLTWTSIDEGIDTKTNKKVWGAEHGPLKFRKVEKLGQNILKKWGHK